MMIEIEKNSFLKYILFGSLYLSEGLEFAVATVIIPIYFVEINIPLSHITLVTGIVMVPWIFKFIFGGIVDHFNKYGRKKFVLIGGLIATASFLIISVIDPATSLLPFALFLFMGHCGIVFIDVAADAWAIETTHKNERGKVNGAMFAGFSTGIALGTISISQLAEKFQYNIAFLTVGIFILITIILPSLIKEKVIYYKTKNILSSLLEEFKKRKTQLLAFFSPISAISFGLIVIAIPLYMKTILKLNKTQIGFITAIFPLTIILGSLIAGIISDRFGRKNTLYLIILTNIFFSALLIFANNWEKLTIIYGILGFLYGAYYTSIFSIFMDSTNHKVSASQYSVFTSLGNLGEISAGTSTGYLIASLGFTRVFLYAAWLYGPTLLILYFIRKK